MYYQLLLVGEWRGNTLQGTQRISQNRHSIISGIPGLTITIPCMGKSDKILQVYFFVHHPMYKTPILNPILTPSIKRSKRTKWEQWKAKEHALTFEKESLSSDLRHSIEVSVAPVWDVSPKPTESKPHRVTLQVIGADCFSNICFCIWSLLKNKLWILFFYSPKYIIDMLTIPFWCGNMVWRS